MGKHGNHPSADSPSSANYLSWYKVFAVPSNSFLYSTWRQQALVESFSVMLSCDQGKCGDEQQQNTKTCYMLLYQDLIRHLGVFGLLNVFWACLIWRVCFWRWRLVEAFGFPSADMKTRDSKFKAVSCCFKHFHAVWFEMQNPLITVSTQMHVDACYNLGSLIHGRTVDVQDSTFSRLYDSGLSGA